MPVCGCSAGEGCVRQIEVSGTVLRIRQRWHPEDRQADVVDHRPPPGLGTCVWEGALALLRTLELSPSLVRGKTVLELGCGTGVVALACAVLGARRVVATDHDKEVLALCQENVEAHGALAARVEVRPYAWGSGAAARSSLAGVFDVVIGADITYDATAMVHLKEDIHSLTEPEAGRLLLAFARRCGARVMLPRHAYAWNECVSI
jgi:predicted nicotinamide N-methyase